MARNIFAGGGVNAFMGDNNPLYVQNMNSLKAAFTDLQNDIASAGSPIGSVIMWTGDTASIPAGYAVANGALLSTVTYATLYGIIGTRYGPLVGADFRLPDLTTRVPQGTVGLPTVPTTKVTSVSSNVDDHTHTVNSALTGANSSIGINTGNVSAHTHAGGVLSGLNSSIAISGANSNIGNTQAHSHPVIGNTGGQSANHTHTYFKPNTGANNSGNNGNADHSHGIFFNSGNANATGINGANSNITWSVSNSNIAVSQIGAPNLYPFFPGVTGIDIVLTGSQSNIGLTAGNATTINASTLTHTHNFAVTELVFIIRVS